MPFIVVYKSIHGVHEYRSLVGKTLSGLPGVNHGHACGPKVIDISGHTPHAVNKGSRRDESVTIGPRTGHVERSAPLGDGCINRKDATVERRQNMAIHPGSKNRALFPLTPFDEEDSYLQSPSKPSFFGIPEARLKRSLKLPT